jgi:hypothetical protein
MPAHIIRITAPLRWSPQRVECPDVEFLRGVETPGGDRARRRQHAIAADDLPGVIVAHQDVIAERVETVGVHRGVVPEGEPGFGREDVVPQPLSGFDERGVGCQQKGVTRAGKPAGVGVVRGNEYGSAAHIEHSHRVGCRNVYARVLCRCTCGDQCCTAAGLFISCWPGASRHAAVGSPQADKTGYVRCTVFGTGYLADTHAVGMAQLGRDGKSTPGVSREATSASPAGETVKRCE